MEGVPQGWFRVRRVHILARSSSTARPVAYLLIGLRFEKGLFMFKNGAKK